jgi:hypothetical protein
MFRYRAAEELYDLKKDPDCLKNLVDSPDYKSELRKMRNWLHSWMEKTRDPLLPAFENRSSPEKLKAALVDIYGDNYTRPANRKRNAPRRKTKVKKPKEQRE